MQSSLFVLSAEARLVRRARRNSGARVALFSTPRRARLFALVRPAHARFSARFAASPNQSAPGVPTKKATSRTAAPPKKAALPRPRPPYRRRPASFYLRLRPGTCSRERRSRTARLFPEFLHAFPECTNHQHERACRSFSAVKQRLSRPSPPASPSPSMAENAARQRMHRCVYASAGSRHFPARSALQRPCSASRAQHAEYIRHSGAEAAQEAQPGIR